MRRKLFQANALCVAGGITTFALFGAPAWAQGIVNLGLYSTGQSSVYSASTQTQFSSGSADTYWSIVSNPSTSGSIAALATNPHPAWLADTGTSKWLSATADSSTAVEAAGNYQYQTTFIIPTNVVLSSVQIVYKMAGDNSIDSVFVNGAATGQSYSSFSAFSGSETINSSNATFVTGSNTLTFTVDNSAGGGNGVPNPEGLNVVFTSATGSTLPEPCSAALLVLGTTAVGVGCLRHRTRINRG